MQQSEIEKLLAALLFDHRIEVAPGSGITAYRPTKRRRTAGSLDSIPCGVCPVCLLASVGATYFSSLMRMHGHEHTHNRTCACTHLLTRPHTHTHTHTHTHACACARARMHAHTMHARPQFTHAHNACSGCTGVLVEIPSIVVCWYAVEGDLQHWQNWISHAFVNHISRRLALTVACDRFS